MVIYKEKVLQIKAILVFIEQEFKVIDLIGLHYVEQRYV